MDRHGSDRDGLQMKRWSDVLAGLARLAAVRQAQSASSTVPELEDLMIDEPIAAE